MTGTRNPSRGQRALCTALAFSMAEHVRETGRSVVLEPMPANERRIVHMALSKDPTVGTSSVGEGDARKVSISMR